MVGVSRVGGGGRGRIHADGRELLTKFDIHKFLGRGSYGSVFRVQRKDDKQHYALKETNVRHMSHVSAAPPPPPPSWGPSLSPRTFGG